MFAYFFNTFYFGYGYRLYELIQNDVLFYSILIGFFLLTNLFARKLNLRLKVIFNLILIFGIFISFVFPYIKGEKIYNNINCTYELVNQIKEYRNKNGSLPLNLNEVKIPQCASELNLKYKILSKGSIFKHELLKEDSFLVSLDIPILSPYVLKFTGHKKEFYSED